VLYFLRPIPSLKVPVATSVDVERTFSKGHILLLHLHNCLSVESTHSLLCLGEWSLLGYVRDSNVKAETLQPPIEGGEESLDELQRFPKLWALCDKLRAIG
jgi:hypothetical protein